MKRWLTLSIWTRPRKKLYNCLTDHINQSLTHFFHFPWKISHHEELVTFRYMWSGILLRHYWRVRGRTSLANDINNCGEIKIFYRSQRQIRLEDCKNVNLSFFCTIYFQILTERTCLFLWFRDHIFYVPSAGNCVEIATLAQNCGINHMRLSLQSILWPDWR